MEKNAFAAFLLAAPNFAGEPIAGWEQPIEDPPDVLCSTMSGRNIGVELTEWLDQEQISEAKAVESIERSILAAIHPVPPNHTEYIHFAVLEPLPKARVKPVDAHELRTELVRLIEVVDSRWAAEEWWHSPYGCSWKDFGAYPTIGKYLSEVHFYPRSAFRNWSSTKGSVRRQLR